MPDRLTAAEARRIQLAAQGRSVVGPEPGEEGELVGPGDDVDRVELHERQAVEHLAEVAAVDTRAAFSGSSSAEALGGELGASSLAGGQAIGHREEARFAGCA